VSLRLRAELESRFPFGCVSVRGDTLKRWCRETHPSPVLAAPAPCGTTAAGNRVWLVQPGGHDPRSPAKQVLRRRDDDALDEHPSWAREGGISNRDSQVATARFRDGT
jgi:hypothetical protein